ncbi:MAG: DUF4301 family protein [Deltaproteobacteria bacterium]|nr:DUF4301 family protein [Deltaproteobacteria bacterium]MBN2845016.1 DUF4301 family protein [Deltaproteobacteria bacterium]
MKPDYFSDTDREEIKKAGLTEKAVMEQIEAFERGPIPVRLDRPCTIDDGIIIISESEREDLLHIYEEEMSRGRIVKFVPASGAASRMFRDWFRLYDTKDLGNAVITSTFEDNLNKFAFHKELKNIVGSDGKDLDGLLKDKSYPEILDYILSPKGLNYANLPKALLKFHLYPDHSRTPLEEQLVEAILSVNDDKNTCRIHFTVSDSHRKPVEDLISRVRKSYEEHYGVTLEISLSIQLPSTDTIAVDGKNRPFRNDKNSLVFRPGGHGSLLKNLNTIDDDFIFLKNIDNVVPDSLKGETILYKKLIGGYLINLQREIFNHIALISATQSDEALLGKAANFSRKKLNITYPETFDERKFEERKDFLLQKLNRPLRVCGMVKNEGEPGGGPFWVKEHDGTLSLQIIEAAQIDKHSHVQSEIWESSTHFNPVDIVCAVQNYRGEKFDLERYVDPDTYIITEKSQEGRSLRALELPGLWNGSMAKWNTVFVEVPLATFNPVKTVDDLLRKEHRNL